MNSSITQYYPYKKQATLLIPIWFVCFGMGMLYFGLSSGDSTSFAVGVIALTGALFLWRHFCTIRKIYIDIINDKLVYLDKDTHTPRHQLIADFHYAYYAKSIKGHAHLIFSMHPVDSEHQKKLANKSSRQSRLQVEDKIVVYLDTSQQAISFKKKATEKYPELVHKIV